MGRRWWYSLWVGKSYPKNFSRALTSSESVGVMRGNCARVQPTTFLWEGQTDWLWQKVPLSPSPVAPMTSTDRSADF